MRQLAELRANGTSSPTTTEIVSRYRCNELHCSNHQKYCFRVSSTHYPLSAEDILLWAKAMLNGSGSATLEKPPSIVWDGLQARKSQNIDAKRGREGYKRTTGVLSNLGPHPSIVKVYVGESSCKKRHSRTEESSSESSTDSNRPRCSRHEPDITLRSSPVPHNNVNLCVYKAWYNSKYTTKARAKSIRANPEHSPGSENSQNLPWAIPTNPPFSDFPIIRFPDCQLHEN
jgi:hypothetical protein